MALKLGEGKGGKGRGKGRERREGRWWVFAIRHPSALSGGKGGKGRHEPFVGV